MEYVKSVKINQKKIKKAKEMNDYQKNVREMFFMSVTKDLNLWTRNKTSKDLYSPDYANFQLNIDYYPFNTNLKLCKGSIDVKIVKYKFAFLILDFKVWKYVKILQKHFKILEQEKKNAEKTSFLKNGLSEMEKHFVKEVRKEKLTQINK